jgi:hypothetical protein
MMIYDSFIEQRKRMARMGKLPVRITFSSQGYAEARAEVDANRPLFEGWTSYMGLPYTIDRAQTERILLHITPLPTIEERRNLSIFEDVDWYKHPRHRYRLVELVVTLDGPRSRLTHHSFPTLEEARAFVDERA